MGQHKFSMAQEELRIFPVDWWEFSLNKIKGRNGHFLSLAESEVGQKNCFFLFFFVAWPL